MTKDLAMVSVFALSMLLYGCTAYGTNPNTSPSPWPTPLPSVTAAHCSDLGGQCVPYHIPECAPPPLGHTNPACYFHCPNGGHVEKSGICGTTPLNGRMVCCVAGPAPTASPSVIPASSPSPSSTPAAGSLADLRYDVLAAVGGTIQFCDRDYYPVSRLGQEQQNADAYVANPPDQADYVEILGHLNISTTTVLTEDQKLQIYREYKRIEATSMQAQADGYFFQFLVAYPMASPSSGQNNQAVYSVNGTVSSNGEVRIMGKKTALLNCPICLSAGTRIDTPQGPIAVEELKPGMSVFTVSLTGEKIVAPIVQTASRPAQKGQPIVHLVLADGRSVWLSAGHPLADGRLVADLKDGDRVDDSIVARVGVGSYGGVATFDILPAGGTGLYWANWILVGSTLSKVAG